MIKEMGSKDIENSIYVSKCLTSFDFGLELSIFGKQAIHVPKLKFHDSSPALQQMLVYDVWY